MAGSADGPIMPEITDVSCFYGVREFSILIQLSEYLFIIGMCSAQDLEDSPIPLTSKTLLFYS